MITIKGKNLLFIMELLSFDSLPQLQGYDSLRLPLIFDGKLKVDITVLSVQLH